MTVENYKSYTGVQLFKPFKTGKTNCLVKPKERCLYLTSFLNIIEVEDGCHNEEK